MIRYIGDAFEEMDRKWGKLHMRAFVEAEIDMTPYHEEFAGLLHEGMLWENLEEMQDMLTVKALEGLGDEQSQ